MKKRYILGSVIVALLMLVSSQIVFLNTVKSDPTCHYGDAEAGTLWITELNVSSAVNDFDYLGVAHVSAKDDWVCWDDGSGNVTADWEVVIGNNHPEYYVEHSIAVYNVDNDCAGLGTDTFKATYNADTSYGEGRNPRN